MQIKALYYFVGRGLEVVSNTNEGFQEEFEDLDGIFQWNVGGVLMFLEAEEGIFTAHYDSTHDDPTVTFIVEDHDKAIEILTGELDGTAAYMAGDLDIAGDINMGMKFTQVAGYLLEALSDLL
ncbi:MAG: SCP2 sterol-binding domain-containing protein [Candidatus Helarchaeota archaeon]|nr:SCP2 sterol-binding domain-containing protein [Candidatus Helarchaeota archaeon]